MSVRVRHLPALGVLMMFDDDGQTFSMPRHQAAAFLAEFMRVLAATVPDMAAADDPGLPVADTFSRKVADVPALHLVAAFACEPDESCGQDHDYPVNRGTPARDLDGYTADDPKRGTLERGNG